MLCSLPSVDIGAGSDFFASHAQRFINDAQSSCFRRTASHGSAIAVLLQRRPGTIPRDNSKGEMKRMSALLRTAVVSCTLLVSACTASFGQAAQQAVEPSSESSTTQQSHPSWNGDSGTVGVGVKASLLGAGIERAMRVTHRSNIRAGFNMITYDRTFDKDGIAYAGQLQFKT